MFTAESGTQTPTGHPDDGELVPTRQAAAPCASRRAADLCADEPEFTEEDMREVIFCSIEDLDDVLIRIDRRRSVENFRRRT